MLLRLDRDGPGKEVLSIRQAANCLISGFTSPGQAYAYIMLPAGAKNLRLFTARAPAMWTCM
jgi:hypothetical protein